MAIFETFTLLFKADSSQLKKEVDDVKKKTDETTKTFKDAEDQTKKTDNQFISLAKSLAAVATAYLSVGAVIGAFRSSVGNTTELAQLSRELNVNIETLDAWGGAIKNFGGDAKSFQSSLVALAKTFNASPETTLAYLPRLAETLKGLGKVQGRIYGESLGIDPATVSFLLQGRKAVETAIARQRELGTVNERDAQIAREFNKAIGETSDAFNDLLRALSVEILPKLTDFAKALTGIIEAFTFWKESPETAPAWEGPSWNQIFGPRPLKPTETESSKSEKKETTVTPKLLNPGPDKRTSTGGIYEIPTAFEQSYQIPTVIPQVTNSQARSLSVGDININTTAQDAKSIGTEVVSQLDQRETTMMDQFQQSNAYFDNGVVI